jgi:hypothetical protein
MSNNAFGVIAFCVLLGVVGLLVAVNPRAIPRMTNAYYALIHMKSRLAEDDYNKVGIRVAGGIVFLIALYVLIARWPQLWK